MVFSIAGGGGMEMLQAYFPSKASVISLTQNAAKMGSTCGGRVDSIAPDITLSSIREEFLLHAESFICKKRRRTSCQSKVTQCISLSAAG
jgi:NAD(P)-dependent dehydrogenase (short-subunit alcohol dehydrogenase family)